MAKKMSINPYTVGLGLTGLALVGGTAYYLSTRPAQAAAAAPPPPAPIPPKKKRRNVFDVFCGSDGCGDELQGLAGLFGRNKGGEPAAGDPA